MKVRIPKAVLEVYSICIKKNGEFNSRKFNSILKDSKEIAAWFELASKTFNIDVTPILVLYSSVIDHLNYYTPICCKHCGRILTLSQVKGRRFCSKSCAAKSDEVRNKTKKTMLQKYGSEHALQVKEFSDKFKKTCLEKYGSENPYSSDVVKSKIKSSLIERYGVDNPSKSQEIKNKAKQTCIEKYGSLPLQNEEIKQKVFKTNLEKYGSKSPLGSKQIQNKSKETWQKKLGVSNPAKSSAVQSKIKQTNLERYGVESPAKNSSVVEKSRKTQRTNFYDVYVSILASKRIELLSTKEEYIAHKPLRFKCLRCGSTWVNDSNASDNYQRVSCKTCRIDKFSSNAEKDVLHLIKELYSGEIIENTRAVIKKKELDIYIPEKKLAFEFDGTFYHSSLFKDYKYHQSKTLACREQGIRLIHIFEYEWMNKREKIISLIKSALGVFDRIIYARQCKVKELSFAEYSSFLEINHLNGSVNSSIRYGLFYKDELIAAIGFGKSRFSRNELELHRYCIKAGYRVIGGFSKLLKHSNQIHFFSYVDLAHFDGHAYEALGFSLVNITSPSYVYVKKEKVLNRLACQKHKLKALLGNAYNSSLTEDENMLNAGYFKIYDAGNLKLEYNMKNAK